MQPRLVPDDKTTLPGIKNVWLWQPTRSMTGGRYSVDLDPAGDEDHPVATSMQ